MSSEKDIKLRKLVAENEIELYPETTAKNIKVTPKNNVPYADTDLQKVLDDLDASAFNGIHGIPNATTTKAGLMSPIDKRKVDNIPEDITSVSVTPILEEGTEIAEISVNGTINTIYAPTIPDSLPASNTTNVYSPISDAPASGIAINGALNTLNAEQVGGSSEYIQSISETNGIISAKKATMPESLPASDVYPWAKASTKPSYSSAEVGAIPSSMKGTVNGVAELDSNGKIPASQLPGFVDDIIDGYYFNEKFYEDSEHTIEITGESGKIYVDVDTSLSYRWSGSVYAPIGSSLALGEIETTAYRGDRGKTAYDHSQAAHARSDATNTTVAVNLSSGIEIATVTTNGVPSKIYAPAIPESLPASNTTDEYSPTGTAPISGKGVKAALDTLNVNNVGGSGKYIQSISETNGIISAVEANMPTIPTSLPASDTVNTYSPNGTVPISGTGVKAALDTLNVNNVGGSGKYIQSISEGSGVINAVEADLPHIPSKISELENDEGYTKNEGTVTKIKVGSGNEYPPINGVVTLPDSYPASNTVDTYTPTSSAPTSGKGVKAALDTLNVNNVGGSGKYIQSISETNGIISAVEANMPSSLPASDTVNTYSPDSTVPISGKGVKAALDTIPSMPSNLVQKIKIGEEEYTPVNNVVSLPENFLFFEDGTPDPDLSGPMFLLVEPIQGYRDDPNITPNAHDID